jgi:POTRA domain, FtsQ-type
VRRRSLQNQRTQRPSRRHRRALRAAVLALALAAGLAGGAFQGRALLARAFPERAAQVRLALLGNQHTQAAELAAAAGVGPGVRLAGLDLARVRESIAAQPWVRSVRVAALPPDQLLVAVEEREPVAAARIGDATWLVDGSGAAFVPAPPDPALPTLLGATAPGDARLAEGAAWLRALAAHGIEAPEALWLSDTDPARAPALAFRGGAARGARVLLGAGERDAKLARLSRLLASGLPELATAAEIDLRFGADVILRPRPDAELATSSTNSNGG